MTERKTFRCAVYTRKSTEEGLDQDFNSLQAQREACEAFIRSQRSEGWVLIPTAYDDGGISGGTMERPALKRLMAQIDDKQVDVVVVYKVDRLTRSLADFSKMVEVFDRRGVSFVAVTQQFNTTTSMGRLTLNVLLSFAQFEREVTAERIRDKIAASKQKGIWMGGGRPRGYSIKNGKLIVEPEGAEVVRKIYARYLACPSIRELSLELKREGITAQRGYEGIEEKPGLSRGALYGLLRSPTYAGLIGHKGTLFQGQHEAIVDRDIWDAAQEKLKAGQPNPAKQPRNESPLKGKLFDAQGRPLMPSCSNKKGKRYRYYISHSDDRDDDRLNQKRSQDWKLAAKEIEERVSEIARLMLADQGDVAGAARAASLDSIELSELLNAASAASAEDRLHWVDNVTLRTDHMMVTLQLPARVPVKLERRVDVVMKRRGVQRRMVIASVTNEISRADPQILKALRIGHQFWKSLMSEQPRSAVAFAPEHAVDNRYVGRALPLAFLPPAVVEQLVTGRSPPDWTAELLLRGETSSGQTIWTPLEDRRSAHS